MTLIWSVAGKKSTMLVWYGIYLTVRNPNISMYAESPWVAIVFICRCCINLFYSWCSLLLFFGIFSNYNISLDPCFLTLCRSLIMNFWFAFSANQITNKNVHYIACTIVMYCFVMHKVKQAKVIIIYHLVARGNWVILRKFLTGDCDESFQEEYIF